MHKSSGLNILLVEDNPDHAEFTLQALAGGDSKHRTYWVKDGEEALDFLHRRRAWADAAASPRPDLIFLDINMPKVDGHAVLRHLKSDDTLRSIPVVMFTTSNQEDEVAATYRAGANSYVTKPLTFPQFMEQVNALKEYWTLTNLLPAT
jgi:two-component system response regulator